MDCPKCNGKLEEYTIEGLKIDRCFVCEGLWFDAQELIEVVRRDAKNFESIDVGMESYDGKELKKSGVDLNKKAGKCPRCSDGSLLVSRPYEKNQTVQVDVCSKGHGVWLDGGEIEKLRKRGLVALNDHLEYYKEMARFVFSKQGFLELLRKAGPILKGEIPRKDPRQE